MKNLLYFTATILFCVFVLHSCQKEQVKLTNTDTDKSSIEQAQVRSGYGPLANFNFPDGTILHETDNSLNFNLPEPYLAIGVDSYGMYVDGGGGSVTCSCSSGSGGCSPAKVGSTVGCVMTTCSSCDKSNSVASTEGNLDDIIIVNPEQLSFYTSSEELIDEIVLPSEFYNHPLIVEKLEEIENNLPPSNNPEDKKTVFANICGYAVTLDIPADVYVSLPYIAAGGTSCGCNSSGSCPKGSKLIATWCDATNCQSCTMSGSVHNPTGGDNYFTVNSDNRILLE